MEWRGELRFLARAGSHEILLDGDSQLGLSPVQALVSALAGCMAIDVVHILEKGRQNLTGLRAEAVAVRADSEPRRLVKVDLRFRVEGEVAPEKVERAIALSRDTYCSVWHSLRPDIELTTSFEIV
jgi:putative redox protein